MNVEDPLCVVYVDAPHEQIERALQEMLLSDPTVAARPPMDIEAVRNLDRNSLARLQFPGGFVFFTTRIEIEPEDPERWNLDDMVTLVASIVEWLWSRGIPAVAACDYEHLLPRSGGYNDPDAPGRRPTRPCDTSPAP